MLTGDSLFVGDAARPDLAVGATEGAEGPLPLAPAAARAAGRCRGLPRARRRLALRQGDELEGVDHDRLRAPVQPDAHARRARRVRRRVGGDRGAEAAQPRHASSSSTAGRSWRAPPLSTSSPRHRADAQLLDVRTGRRLTSRATSHGAINVPVSGSSFATKAGFVLDADEPRRRARRETAAEARARDRAACARSAFLDLAGYVLGGGPERVDVGRRWTSSTR